VVLVECKILYVAGGVVLHRAALYFEKNQQKVTYSFGQMYEKPTRKAKAHQKTQE